MAIKQSLGYIVLSILRGERDLDKLKRKAAHKFSLSAFPKNTDIFKAFPKTDLTPEILALLKRKPMRTLSGVSPIAVMVKPQGSCRWGCIYCPFTGKAPKSYTGSEPAALRARDNDFNPRRQVRSRIKQFALNCHPTDKCDVILMGGTFLEMDNKYKSGFISGIYQGLNWKKSSSLEGAKKANETAAHRMVGLTIETRPDVCGKKQIAEMLGYGATKVELGVQHPSDSIYRKINRGHKVSHVVDATALLKDSALKVAYHIMPGLPGSSPSKDVQMVRKLFSDMRLRPDMLKIYPTLVLEGTKLHSMMESGEYQPYSAEQAAEVIAQCYRHIPKYVRVMRIQRDIPANLVSAGVKKGNLREMVERKAAQLGIGINEIRFREAGLSGKTKAKTEFTRLDYIASKGKESFLSYEDKEGTIAAFLRLRIPHAPFMPQIRKCSSLVRELHVFGEEAGIGETGKIQHRGLGSFLLNEAERISKEAGMDKIIVMSAVGVRPYYSKRGYRPDGPYMSKSI